MLCGDELTAALVGIGMNFAAPAQPDANIEDALLSASVEALEGDDLRLLSVLTTWLRVHHPRVNADRLFCVVRVHGSDRVRAYWAAVGHWLVKDRRFARFATLYDGPRLDLPSVGTAFHVGRFGEDPRFVGSPLRVPANVLRDRDDDVLAPAAPASHGTWPPGG